MSDRFTYDGTYTRKFALLSIAGAILVGLGLWLSTLKSPAAHEGGHGEAAAKPEMFAQAGHNDPVAAHDSIVSDADSAHAMTPAVHTETHTEHGPDAGHGEKYVNPASIGAAETHYSQFNPEAAGEAHHNHWDQGEPSMMKKIGTALLVAIWYFLVIAIFGVFFQAIKHVANAGWYVTVKRIFEVMYRWIPIGIVLLIAFFLIFGKEIYQWMDPAQVDAQTPTGELIRGKAGFLNVKVLFVLLGLIGLIFTFVGHRFRTGSLREDTEGGTSILISNRRMSAMFLPFFAFSFVGLAFMTLMSIDVTWFSTIFGVYCFANMFVLGTTVATLIVVHMKEKGLMESVTDDHIHDLGKFMFAFSVFWAYIWVSQYLLIWYANIPEETQYYRLRSDEYKFLFFFNLLINFVFPFLALMTRNAKRYYSSIKFVGGVILFGRFIDIFLMIVPGVMKANWSIGIFIASLGMVMFFGGIFLMVIFSGIAGAGLLPKKHPFLEESLHHDVGI